MAYRTPTTRFGIASGTKGFTALTIMSLVTDGSLALDASVEQLLGDRLGLITTGVTVGQLLSHTSGIGDYLDESALGDIEDYVMPVPVHQLAKTTDYLVVLRNHPAKFAPGERFEYCNSGFVILALIAEVVSGSSFYELVAERVLKPAGMTATEFLRSDQLPGSAAIGYLPTDGAWRTNHLHLPVRGSGDGGAYSTVGDFAAFWPALFAGRIVARALVDEMIRPHHDIPSRSMRYGLGFWIRADRATVMLEGSDPGVSFRSAYDPGTELLYTVMSNTTRGAWPPVKVLDGLLPDLVRP
jgi:CubicO group peptidase (beta-lactamase class C family)